jgi:hypothetical protein
LIDVAKEIGTPINFSNSHCCCKIHSKFHKWLGNFLLLEENVKIALPNTEPINCNPSHSQIQYQSKICQAKIEGLDNNLFCNLQYHLQKWIVALPLKCLLSLQSSLYSHADAVSFEDHGRLNKEWGLSKSTK